jgi:hypothetical protein
LLLAIGAVVGFAWWTNTRNLSLLAAWEGFSPVGFVRCWAETQHLAADYPSGIATLGASAFMSLYKLAYLGGVPPETFQIVVTGFEILAFVAALLFLLRTLHPEATRTDHVILALLAVASHARDLDLARYREPSFIGQYYAVADALRLLAIGAFLRGRTLTAGVSLSLTFLVHPTKALMAAVFLAAAAVAHRPRQLLSPRVLASAVLFLVVGAAWSAHIAVGASGAPLPFQSWLELVRMGGYHWFPVDAGLFSHLHQERFIGLLAFTALLTHYMVHGRPLRAVERQIAAGFIASALLAGVGVALSVAPFSATVVRLALHRACEMIALVGLPYLVVGLLSDLRRGGVRAALAAAMLVSPFVLKPGYPLWISVALLLPARTSLARRPIPTCARVDLALAGALTAIAIAYAVLGYGRPWIDSAYTALNPELMFRPAVAAVALVGLAGWLGKRLGARPLGALLGLLACAWLWRSRPMADPAVRALAADYLEAQRWAAAATPANALFMPDPGHGHGWREFSGRSSFGTVREWTYTGFLYRWSSVAYHDGRRRVAELGLDPSAFLGYRPPMAGAFALQEAARHAYYERDETWFTHMARTYGIHYFVRFKQYVKKPLDLPIAFENRGVIIHAAPRAP